MRIIVYLSFYLSAFLISCQGGSAAQLTANEQKGLDEVRTNFDGAVTHKMSGTGDGQQAFEISLGESQALNQFHDLSELAAANIAWLFFKNLQEEKGQYSAVKVNLQMLDKSTKSFNFPTDSMLVAMGKIAVIEQAAALLKAGNYDGLYALFDPEIAATTTVDKLKGYCTQYDTENGAITDFKFQGYAFFMPASQVKELLQLSGRLKRSNSDTPLSIYVDPTKPEAEGSMFAIKFDY